MMRRTQRTDSTVLIVSLSIIGGIPSMPRRVHAEPPTEAKRAYILVRTDFAGSFEGKKALSGLNSTAAMTPGIEGRFEAPLAKYFTTGLTLSFYAVNADDDFENELLAGGYEFGADVGTFGQARLPWTAKGDVDMMMYLIVPLGLSMITSRTLGDNTGFGWHIRAAIGYEIFVSDRVSLQWEFGWTRTATWYNTPSGRGAVILNQGSNRIGVVIAFP